MRTYIAPIGYDSTRVTRPVLSHGIGRSDCLHLLQPSSENSGERGTQAVEDVKRMVEQIEPSVEVTTTEIPHDDFETAVMICNSHIEDATGETIVVFGGGARDIFLALTVATLTKRDVIDTSLQFSDIDGKVREHQLPDLTANTPPKTKPTFMAIGAMEGPIALPELTEKLDVSKSTVTRHVKLLDQQGLLTSETHGKTKIVELTYTGRLLLGRE